MIIEIIKIIKHKFNKEKNLFFMDLGSREEYYKELETFQDAYNYYKTHKGEIKVSKEDEEEILEFFKFIFNLGDFLTPLNFKEISFIFEDKRNQLKYSLLLLDCAYLLEDIKAYENILYFIEKNINFFDEEERKDFFLKNGLFKIIKCEKKDIEKFFEKLIELEKEINENEIKKIKNQILISKFNLEKNQKKILKIENGELNDLKIEKLIERYNKSIGSGDFYEEKFYRNLLEKFLKEKPLDIQQLNNLTEFLSKIDTFFLSNHNKEVKDMSLKICEMGKKIWTKDIDIEKIERSAYFHDLGKLSIPWILIDKKIPLNEKEKEKFEYHSILSSEILKNANLEKEAIFALEHHKYINGKGYPKDNNKPSFEGNIICLAESFIGATNLSSKSKVRQKEELFIEFKQLRGIYFYPEIVDSLLLLE